MKQFRWLTALLVGAFLLTGVAFGQGSAEVICAEVGTFDYAYKIDGWDEANMTGDYTDPVTGVVFSIVDYKPASKTFDWSATAKINAVVVKGGAGSAVYEYDPAVTSDNGLSAPSPADVSNVTFCWNAPKYDPLEVEKTAEGSYDLRVEWELEKEVDEPLHEGVAGDDFLSEWKVTVTRTEYAENYLVEGTITITNPNDIPVDFEIGDVLNDGTIADVTCPITGDNTGKVPANGFVVCDYTADPFDGSATLNTATVTSLTDDVDGGQATAPVSFESNIVGSSSATLSDDRFNYASDTLVSSFEVLFPEPFECSADAADYGVNGEYDFLEENTAVLTLEAGGSLEADASVLVICTLPALEVSKTAEGEYDREVTWELEKSVDPAFHSGGLGSTFESTWSVVATKTDSGPMNFRVTGEITIDNPAAIDQDFFVVDFLDDGTEADVSCPTYTVPAGGSVVCTYVAEPADDSATLNTATVSADGNADQIATDGIDWTENLTGFDTARLVDERFDYDEWISATTQLIEPEPFECSADFADYGEDGFYSFTETNVAELYVGDAVLMASATVTIECRLQFQGETAWAANGDAPGSLRYNLRGGNWATYVQYFGVEKTTTLFAGQTTAVGTVVFSDPVDDMVTITVYVELEGWIVDPNDMTLAVQDYANAPSGNPSPGLFDHKATCDATSCTIEVPENNFYGVHVNVGYWY